MSGDMAARVAAWLAHRLPAASDVAVDALAQIHGGSSQETFRLDARWREDGRPVEEAMVLRRVPASGTVVVEEDLEYTIYAALVGQGLPVPRVLFRERDPMWLDRPFFVMERCPGRAPAIFEAQPYGEHAAAIARDFWRHLGRLAAIDHRAVGLGGLRNGDATDGFWYRELAHWEAILDAGERHVEPAVRGAIRWLRANPPPAPAKPAIVHGDYRSGNFLFADDGRISAILDWEMGHVGDPLEDIAWATNPMWPMTRHLPEEEGLAIWEAASGMAVDRAALDWWRLFATVKGCGIWTTAEAALDGGTTYQMVVAGSAVRGGHFHRAELLRRMAERKGLA